MEPNNKMETTNKTVSLVKPKEKAAELDNFFGKAKKEKDESQENIWRVSLILTTEDQDTIEKGFGALPRDYKAIRDYFRESMLATAKKDIEKGERIQKLMKEMEKE